MVQMVGNEYGDRMKVQKVPNLGSDTIEASDAEDAPTAIVPGSPRSANLAALVSELEAHYGPADPALVAEFEEVLR
ncbi:MAG: hypothetical protein QM619_15535 [Micropruina sp.]|uniref:hypothetical protein n=1 Tax=Micropruina sp. TaxID=2737536 RepID=UPI0039E507D0